MKQPLFILSVFFLIIPFHLTGQNSERTSYFPYQTGDFWVNEVYHMYEYYSDEKIDVIADSVNSEGEKVYTVSSNLFYPNERIYHIKIDSSGNIHSDLWYDKGNWLKIFDSGKDKGETWILERDSLDEQHIQYELAEVMDEYIVEIFDTSTIVKEVRYARTDNDTTSTQEGHGRWYVWWSEKFGIIEQRSLGFGGLEPVLKGAKIGNTVYGDTLFVSIESNPGFSELPRTYQISNYPNPFNSSTIFVIETTAADNLTMEVYDQVGRKVAEIFNNKHFTSGRHTIPWKAGNMATGIYFVRMSGNGGVEVLTITYLK